MKMTVREFAKKVGFEVVGKLTYKGKDENGYKMWTDEAGNEFYKNEKGYCIADNENGVW